MIEQDEIKRLIKKGFDLELISFEFEIPIENVRKCKQELEEAQDEKKFTSYNLKNKTTPKLSRIDKMRERYNQLFWGSNRGETKTVQAEPLSEQEIELIESVTRTIELKIQEMEFFSREENRKTAREIFKELDKITGFQLTIEQAENLVNLIESPELNKVINTTILDYQAGYDNLYYKLRNEKNVLVLRLVKAIDIAQAQTEDIEKLKFLSSKITPYIIAKYERLVGGLKSRMNNKISIITQRQAIDKIRNNVSSEIEKIIMDIASGTLDTKSANSIIEEEAKKKFQSRPQTRFSLTEEQERMQILMQIKMVLKEKADKYYIKNPDISISLLQELCGGELEQSITFVAGNLIGRKDFERAQQICDKFAGVKSMYKYTDLLKREIRCAEIGNFVIRGLNMQKSPQEEREYFILLERGLENSNLELKSIPLGKSNDGLRNITLADIWYDKKRVKNIE